MILLSESRGNINNSPGILRNHIFAPPITAFSGGGEGAKDNMYLKESQSEYQCKWLVLSR